MAVEAAGDSAGTGLVEIAVRDSAVALGTVLESMERLDDDAVRAPSHLAGWTRGHVLAHIDGVGSALARQAERATVGERVAVYDGGQTGRDAEIDAHAGRSADDHVEAIQILENRLAAAWPEPGSAGWETPVVYRQGTVADSAMAWWREVRIHLVDLDVGVGAGSWDDALCGHLLTFLDPRLSEAGRVVLLADNADVRHAVGDPDGRDGGLHHGAGSGALVGRDDRDRDDGDSDGDSDSDSDSDSELIVRGSLQDLTAWLAGREPDVTPAASRGGAPAELPVLGPWPSSAR